MTPLTFSLLADQMAEHMVRRRLANAGLSDLASAPVFRLARGHVYVNASLVAEVMGEIPAALLSDGLLDLLPRELRAAVLAKQRSLVSPRTVAVLANLTWREHAWMPWARADLFRDAVGAVAADLDALAPTASASGRELALAIAALRGRLASYLEVVSWGMIYAYVFFHLTAHLLESWAPDEAADVADLTMGLEGVWTFAIHDHLLRCAALARRDPGVREALEAGSERAAARCEAGELGAFGASFRDLIDRHGHRLVGRDLSYPTWRERPSVVIDMIAKLVEAGTLEDSARRRARREDLLQRATRRVSAGLGGTIRGLVFQRCVTWCQEYYSLRENMRYHADLFLAAMRRVALLAGDGLVGSGHLRARDDVFYLEAGELDGALSTTPPAEDGARLADLAAARRLAYDAYRDDRVPEILYGDLDEDVRATPGPEPRDGAVPAIGEDGSARRVRGLLAGLGVAPGRAVGRARVVHNVDDLNALRAGEVIVATSTDPSWTSLLALGGALVLEMGGLLSHGAIVARELGIPAVVNVPQATRMLATGDRVTVDGRSGTVAFE